MGVKPEYVPDTSGRGDQRKVRNPKRANQREDERGVGGKVKKKLPLGKRKRAILLLVLGGGGRHKRAGDIWGPKKTDADLITRGQGGSFVGPL